MDAWTSTRASRLRALVALGGLGLAPAVTACNAGGTDGINEVMTEHAPGQTKLFRPEDVRKWRGGSINLCIQERDVGTASRADIDQAKQMIVDTINATWAKEAGSGLKIHYRCRSDRGVYVALYAMKDTGGIGGRGDFGEQSQPTGANLHFCAPSIAGSTCSQWTRVVKNPDTNADEVTVYNNVDSWRWFRTVIIHELGHVLGFLHEHERPDVPDRVKKWCPEASPGWTHDPNRVDKTAYDDASIMNYCRDADGDRRKDLPWIDQLSERDKEGVRKAYPVCDSDAGPNPACPGTAESWPPGSGVCYWGHLEGLGWRYACNGDWVGTKDQARRLEAVTIIPQESVRVCYEGHVQDVGWMRGCDGAVVGTTGQNKRLEALRVWTESSTRDVSYRGWVQNAGLHSSTNGGTIGTEGRSLRMEAFSIRLD